MDDHSMGISSMSGQGSAGGGYRGLSEFALR